MATSDKLETMKCTQNVFEDFGSIDSEQALVKSNLAMYIQDALEGQSLTQREAGELMGIDQAKVSAIVNGKLKGFTIERLLKFLNALDVDVEIKLKPKANRSEHAQTLVTGRV